MYIYILYIIYVKGVNTYLIFSFKDRNPNFYYLKLMCNFEAKDLPKVP